MDNFSKSFTLWETITNLKKNDYLVKIQLCMVGFYKKIILKDVFKIMMTENCFVSL